MRVAGRDILLPTMMVGNYPKPRWFTGQPWSEIPAGRYAADSISFEAFSDAILAIVHDQDAAGLDVISDGLMVSGDSPFAAKLYYLTERIAGFTPYGPSIILPTYSTEHSPIVDGKLIRKCPLYSEQVRVLRKATSKPIKVNFPGLHVLAMASINRYYSDVKDLAFALAKIYNDEFRELVAAGCDIIQLDEFTWHLGLSQGEWESDVFNAAVDGVDADIHVHVCWGSLTRPAPGTDDMPAGENPAAHTGRAASIFPRAQLVHVDVLNYEIARHGAGDLVPLEKNAWDKGFVAGVIDVKSLEIEPAEEVAHRIRACLDVVPPDRLGVSTDCGLVDLPRRVARAKLRSLVEGRNIVRAELSADSILATNP
ncbi:MAG TPA: cobalamin-independent methionine synthase II family protein [Acidimicrobiia bacterium]|jgi:5-methyltetrahydropteroyltriglutamate--homocysteine methyltransferase|nr:cobalamin-independent methionine synthase II family protein [Acidimicrobiia bacterium]